MTNPITDLLALRRLPAALAADLGVITDAMRSVRAIETMLASLLTALGLLLTDVERLRKTVEPPSREDRAHRTDDVGPRATHGRDRNHRSPARVRRRPGAARPARSRR